MKKLISSITPTYNEKLNIKKLINKIECMIKSLANKYDDDLVVIEVWYGDKLSEEDISRYEDIYGRV